MSPSVPRRAAAILFVLAIAALVPGCFNPFNPLVAKNRAGAVDPPPFPSRPDLVIRLFEWCWDHRSIVEYEEIFTEDFLFEFAATDTAGNAFRGRALTRFDEIETTRHLFVGGGTSPPANSITLLLDQNLIPGQDSREGREDTTYFQQIVTQVTLRIDTDEEDFQVTGQARFFLVRGDSALIPAELVARGFGPDPGRWYIQRWEDETQGSNGAFRALRERRGSGLAARPSAPGKPPESAGTSSSLWPREATWGFVKSVFYRPR
jgi:hypothetical protein